MRSPLPTAFPPKVLAVIAVALALAGCQTGSGAHPVPSVAQIGADLNCPQGDHAFEDQQAGWGFCYPASWKYLERSQAIPSPPGLDLTFDITFDPPVKGPCPTSAAQPTGSPSPAASPCAGDFANMIISTYERGSSTDLSSWLHANMAKVTTADSIAWGNATEAVRLADGRRVALTPHHVVVMDLHVGLLNLETEMSARLNTWKFSF
ncbi:MAG TPA: hypothetical protein VN906_12915 [Candidatus Sulfotelmatobacter sp.]|nr:hypothetical protein [Candidatus Sulfotelmatobacter sp.]